MSFKRDGDDKCALASLRKRRVADLLYEELQDDEVSQLSNGRYVCKACHHRPMFDTISMFQVHKQGKKHQNSMLYQEKQKQELQDLIDKRRHEQFVKNGKADIQQAIAASSRGRALPYDPRAKKHKSYDRKETLDLHRIVPSDKVEPPVFLETTSHDVLPGNRETENYLGNKKWSNANMNRKEMCGYNLHGTNHSGDIIGTNLGTKSGTNILARNTATNTTAVTRQQQQPSSQQKNVPSKSRKSGSSSNDLADDKVIDTNNVQKLVSNVGADRCSKHYFARRQQAKTAIDITDVPKGTVGTVASQQAFTKSWEYYKNLKEPTALVHKLKGKEAIKMCTDVDKCDVAVDVDARIQDEYEETGDKSKSDKGKKDVLKDPAEKKERAEKFMKAFGSGWKRDWDGRWVKDADAEFDSDEEPPDVN